MHLKNQAEFGRLGRAAAMGAVAAVVMSAFMALGVAFRIAPHQGPFPYLLVRHALRGVAVATGGLVMLAVFGHLAYGALAGLVFAFVARPMTIGRGVAFGFVLWFAMQMTFVPWLGWADFGLAHSRTFAVYALGLHVVYGAALGWLGNRDDVLHHARFDELERLRA